MINNLCGEAIRRALTTSISSRESFVGIAGPETFLKASSSSFLRRSSPSSILTISPGCLGLVQDRADGHGHT